MSFIVTNYLEVKGSDPFSVLMEIKPIGKSNPLIDFTRIIPMPAWVLWKEIDDPVIPFGRRVSTSYRGRQWMKKNWGTAGFVLPIPVKDMKKFTQSDIAEKGYVRIKFLTEDTPAHKVIKALSLQFPDYEFRYSWWSNQRVGWRLGMETFRNGTRIELHSPEFGSSLAFQMLFTMEGKTAEEMGYEYDRNKKTYVKKLIK